MLNGTLPTDSALLDNNIESKENCLMLANDVEGLLNKFE